MPGIREKFADIVLEFLLGGSRKQGEGDVCEELLAELADEIEVAREERCIGLLVGEIGVLADDLPDPFDQIRPVDDRLLADEGAVVVEDGDPLRRGYERIAPLAGDLFEELEDRGLGGAVVPARQRIDEVRRSLRGLGLDDAGRSDRPRGRRNAAATERDGQTNDAEQSEERPERAQRSPAERTPVAGRAVVLEGDRGF